MGTSQQMAPPARRSTLRSTLRPSVYPCRSFGVYSCQPRAKSACPSFSGLEACKSSSPWRTHQGEAHTRTRICVISLVRLEALTKFSETDGSYRNSLPTILTLVESALGVISACLIVMRPIFGRFFPDRLKLTKRGGQSSAPVISRIKQSKPHRQTTRNPVDMKGISDGRFVRLDEDPYALPLLNADKAAAERVVDFGPVPTASHTAYKHRDVEAQ